jgi:ABC-type Fe3+-siderophore transport system permease subunit
MRRLPRVLGLALLWVGCYLIGLAFVAYLTLNLYVDVNVAGTTAWEECDDCGFYLSDEAWLWTMAMAALYSAACLGLVAYLVSRRRRRGSANDSPPLSTSPANVRD